jgi:hypothetical protein
VENKAEKTGVENEWWGNKVAPADRSKHGEDSGEGNMGAMIMAAE